MASGQKTKRHRKQVEWRVRVVMAERGIRTVTALKHLLQEVGGTISNSQLGRLIDGKLQLWNQEVIEGLLTVLECEIGDILSMKEGKNKAPQVVKPSRPVAARKSKVAQQNTNRARPARHATQKQARR